MTTPRDLPFSKGHFNAIALACIAMLACHGHVVMAQTVPAASTDAAQANVQTVTSDTAKNGFAPHLDAKTKARAVRKNGGYSPVKALEEPGNVPEIEMFVGESRVLPAPGVGRIAVGNGRILTAAVLDKKEVLVFANEAGISSLFIWNEDGRYQRLKINIVPGDTSRVGREIAAFVAAIPGAKASIVGDKVIVEGDRLSDQDLGKIKSLEKIYPQLLNFTNPRGWDQMVMMDVKVVEFPKTKLNELGLKWSPVGGAAVGAVWMPFRHGNQGPYQIQIPVGGSGGKPPLVDIDTSTGTAKDSTSLYGGINALSGVNIGLSALLQALAQEGSAAVLAEPQLSTRSGTESTFLSGGEYPYTVQSIEGPHVEFKKYGISLQIKPLVDKDGFIRAEIKSEVSSIDPSVSTVSGPAIRTRRTETEFNVKSGQTIVLSGLLSRDMSTNFDKVPFLGDIPILGALFRSKRYMNNETELVVFVTPTVVDTTAPGLVDRVNKTHERLKEAFGEKPYLSEPLQPARDLKEVNAPVSVSTDAPSADTSGQGGSRSSTARALPAPMPVKQVEAAKPLPADNGALVKPNDNPLVAKKPASTAQPAAIEGKSIEQQVTLEGLALRANPDINAPILMHLGQGAIVRVSESGTAGSGDDAWRRVTVGAVTGWSAARWLAPVANVAQAVPGKASSNIGKSAQQGKRIEPLKASTKLVARPLSAEVPATADTPVEKASPKYRVVLPKLALRVSPDVNALIVMQVQEGAIVEGLPQGSVGGWTAVQAGDASGWVDSQWITQTR